MDSRQRPLSPHLGIYRPQITSVLSILHRLTGVALAFGAVLLTYWLSAGAYGPEAFARAQEFMGSWFGRSILLGLTFSLFYHLCNGIRHLAWDAGWGFELPTLRATGWIVLIASVILTGVTWVLTYKAAGIL
ncbi:MAG: succinate dehydrogenase, cytochrome b556 subunit [Rhodospirillaceae bacterium]|jgi:succinate dehydrogenase / fumarate reductase cytochrome b subunit